jgi:3-phosphoshikimate 1-carboxyvinyltransferase
MPAAAIEIRPISRPIDAVVTVPGSKSFTNRALLVAALAEGKSVLTGALFSDDTHYMSEALRRLGVAISSDARVRRFEVAGNGGRIPVDRATLYIGNAGTAARSLVSYVALGHGTFVIDGDEPMRRTRPISDLLDALRKLGVDARSQAANGCLPVVINARGVAGGRTQLDASKSSQFLTSLMLAAPYMERGLTIEMLKPFKTAYIDITMAVMRAFGIAVENDRYRTFHVAGGQRYQPRVYAIEPDASSASYLFAAAALTGGRVRVEGITSASAQGDVRFVDVLEAMGCTVRRDPGGIEVTGPAELRGIDIDMQAMSDTFLTLAAIAPFASSPVSIRNIEHTRWQETDRIKAVATELGKLGVTVAEQRDGLTISPSRVRPAAVDTYRDHRMAMSFALLGLRVPGIHVNDPGCVAKTFPEYFQVLESLTR